LHKITNCDTGEVTLYANGEEREFSYPDVNGNKFKHLYFGWNPEGHAPPGIYDIAHLDLHWYFINATERDATAAVPACESNRCEVNGLLEEVTCEDLALCEAPTIDADRFMSGGSESSWGCVACVPSMGVHCFDPDAAAELTAGKDFDDTFFMTRWDGIVNSNEAMITLDAYELLNEGLRAEKCVSFRTPEEYVFGDGCYPSVYCYGCGKETEFGDDKCWTYLTGYESKPDWLLPSTTEDASITKWEGDAVSVGTTSFTAFYHYDGTECSDSDKLGIYFDRAGLTNLPADIPDNTATNALHKITNCDTGEVTLYANGEEREFSYPDVNGNKFKHLYFGWNPEGHAPPGIYDIAHLDLHWYFINATERDATAAVPACESNRCEVNGLLEEVTCEDLALCEAPTIDADRFMSGGSESSWGCVACVPSMGVHCFDPDAAAELTAGKDFDDTFFMTRWDGIVNSNEAMITLDAYELLNEGLRAEKCVSFRTPEEYVFGDGCYPSVYCYGCGKETEFGDDKCWAYLTGYGWKASSAIITTELSEETDVLSTTVDDATSSTTATNDDESTDSAADVMYIVRFITCLSFLVFVYGN